MNKLRSLGKRKYLIFSLVISSFQLFGQLKDIPEGYYSNAEGLSGYSLKTALHNIIKSGHVDQGYSALYTAYAVGDNDPDDNYVWDMYSENPDGDDPYNFTHHTDKCGNYSSEGDCYNREHLFPQGIFGSASPMKADYHHVVPSDGKVNGMRGSYPFGETDNPSWTSLNGSKRGSCSYPGYSGTVFEPIDEYKGDIARCMLYFATRYEDKIASWSHDMINGTTDQVYADWFIEMLVEWHLNDPVSAKDIMRNEAGYDHQGNRNPFIDHPEYVTAIWGGNAAAVITEVTTLPLEPTNADEVHVSANITDSDGIESVELKWGTSSGLLDQTIGMSSSAGNSYKTNTQIPAQSDGITVYYKIVVSDNLSVASSSDVKSYQIGDVPEPVVLLFEDFETTTDDVVVELEGWQNINEVGAMQWEGRIFADNKYAQAASYQSGEENVVWLVTPQINLDQSINEVFSFDVNVGHWRHEGFSVLLSTNLEGSNVENATWDDISSNFNIPTSPSNGYGTMANAGSISLNSYTGYINIAFKYAGSDAGSAGETTTYQVDNVSVEGVESLGDNQAPVLTFSPTNEAVNIGIGTNVEISSNEKLLTNQGNTIDATYLQSVITFRENSIQGTNVAYTASIDAEMQKIVVTPTSNLNYEIEYFVEVSALAFEDTAANETLKKSITFSTQNTPDETAPILTFLPENGTENVDFDLTITISSSEGLLSNSGTVIDETYLNSVLTFKKESSEGANINFSAAINASKDVVTIIPSNNLEPETSYYVALAHAAFEDTAANETVAQSIIFNTKAGPDIVAPDLTLVPSDGATDIELDAQIIISSTETLLSSTGTQIDVAYLKSVIDFNINDANGASVSFTPEINSAQTQITLAPDNDLLNETIYYVAVQSQAFADTASNKTLEANVSFTTKPVVDITSPDLTVKPSDGSENIAINTQIVITSNEALYTNTATAIDQEYIEGVIAIKQHTPDGEDKLFTASLSADQKTITLVPLSEFNYETTYHVLISENAFEDLATNEIQAQSSSFTTLLPPDTSGPEFKITPSLDSVGAAVTTSVTIESDEPIFTLSGALVSSLYLQNNIQFLKETESGDPVDFSVVINAEGNRIILSAYNYLDYQTTYFIGIAENVFTDALGNKNGVFNSSFTTQSAPDNQAPEFISGYPKVVNAGTNSFSLEFSLNEPGKVFYKLQESTDNTPSLQSVLENAYKEIDQANTVYQVNFTDLNENVEYMVYLLTQDNNSNMNTSSEFVTITQSTQGNAPIITLQPLSDTLCQSEAISLTILAEGSGTLSYQWFFNDYIINEANTATLNINDINESNSGMYYCKVENAWGSQNSDNVELLVHNWVSAGESKYISTLDTVTYINLFDSLQGNPSVGGVWIEDNDNNGAFDNGVFYPSVAGTGIYIVKYRVEGACNTEEAFITIKVDAVSTIEAKYIHAIKLYPNPTRGQVSISGIDYMLFKALYLYTIDYKLLESFNSPKIDIGHLNNGIYFVKIVGETQQKTIKLIKK